MRGRELSVYRCMREGKVVLGASKVEVCVLTSVFCMELVLHLEGMGVYISRTMLL